MIGRGEGQDVDAFATVEQFLIRGLDAACQLCVVGLPRSGSRRSAWPLPKSPEDYLNRRRRPGCRLEVRRASQAAIIVGSTLRPIAQMNPTSSRATAVITTGAFSAARAFGDSARKGEAAPSRRWRGPLPQSPPADAAWPVRPSPATDRPKPPPRSISVRRCCGLDARRPSGFAAGALAGNHAEIGHELRGLSKRRRSPTSATTPVASAKATPRRASRTSTGTVRANKYRPFPAPNPAERVGDS
jgi:hypothetical protein